MSESGKRETSQGLNRDLWSGKKFFFLLVDEKALIICIGLRQRTSKEENDENTGETNTPNQFFKVLEEREKIVL